MVLQARPQTAGGAPRDILRIVVGLCDYEGVPYQMTPQLIDEACRAYFVAPQTYAKPVSSQR